ncbi:methyltransferase type 11 [Pseudoxanthomonas kalamensis DSM 18571]|nr:methyltransferase type 11 [Pseudoxanthomonas kalamensis DSM 18571]
MPSRWRKARKIEQILGRQRIIDCRNLLEIGTGSGMIASYFSTVIPHGKVHAVDTTDNLVAPPSFAFQKVQSTILPFEQETLDIVISNHVLEHVGDRGAQISHLREIRRVLDRQGIAYLAVPNRWSLYEAHYRLPLLSWLPHPWSDRYLHAFRNTQHYDCEPLGPLALRRMFKKAGLAWWDVSFDALQLLLAQESSSKRLGRAASRLWPVTVPLYPILPTYVFLLSRTNR